MPTTMPRRARLFLPGVPMHVVQRGNNRQACFFSDDDYRCYLEWLGDASKDAGCSIHAYVLMTNHVHLLLSAHGAGGAGGMMKALGQRYVQHVNRICARSGTLWEGRYRSCLVQDDRYLLTCMRYIELNPVRAGMVDHPGANGWSSYRYNAQGEADELIQPHAVFTALDADPRIRAERYRGFFQNALEPGEVHQIRTATNGNYALGNDRFAAQLASTPSRRVTPGRAGRPPKKSAVPESKDLFESE
jgi:putative transposase